MVGALVVYKIETVSSPDHSHEISIENIEEPQLQWVFARIKEFNIKKKKCLVSIGASTTMLNNGEREVSIDIFNPRISACFEWQMCFARTNNGLWWPAVYFGEPSILIWVKSDQDAETHIDFAIDPTPHSMIPFSMGTEHSHPDDANWTASMKLASEFAVDPSQFFK